MTARRAERRGAVTAIATAIAITVVDLLGAAAAQTRVPRVIEGTTLEEPTPSGVPSGVPSGAPAATPVDIAPSRPAEEPVRRAYTIQPGIAARYTWSDNIDLRARGAERSGSITELSPFVRADLATARGYGSLNYMLRGLQYNGSEIHDRAVRHDLRAIGDIDLAGDALRVAALAQRFDLSRSPFGVGSFDAGARGIDRTTYTRFDLSPYSIGRLTASTDYEVRYRFSQVDPGASYVSNRIHGVTAELGSAPGHGAFGWLSRADAFQSRYDNGFDYRNVLVEVLGTWAPSSTLRLGAGINYASNSVLVKDGKSSGVGPTLGLQWTPTAQSLFSARWSSTYYGQVARAQASYLAGRLRFGATWERGIRDGNQASVLYYDPMRLFVGATGRWQGSSMIPVPGALQVGAGAGAPLASIGAQSPIVDLDTLVGTVEFLGSRGTFLVTAYATDQRAALVVPGFPDTSPLELRGLFVRYAHRLDARNTVSADARGQTASRPGTEGESTLTSVGLEWRTQLGRQMIGSVGLRANRQRGTGGLPEYDERGAGAGLEYRF